MDSQATIVSQNRSHRETKNCNTHDIKNSYLDNRNERDMYYAGGKVIILRVLYTLSLTVSISHGTIGQHEEPNGQRNFSSNRQIVS